MRPVATVVAMLLLTPTSAVAGEAFVLGRDGYSGFQWPGADGKRVVMSAEEVELRTRIRHAKNTGGWGVGMMVLGAVGGGATAIAQVAVDPDAPGADTGLLVGYIASGTLFVTGVVFTGVGYGRAAGFKRKLNKLAVVPQPRPDGAGLALVGRW